MPKKKFETYSQKVATKHLEIVNLRLALREELRSKLPGNGKLDRWFDEQFWGYFHFIEQGQPVPIMVSMMKMSGIRPEVSKRLPVVRQLAECWKDYLYVKIKKRFPPYTMVQSWNRVLVVSPKYIK